MYPGRFTAGCYDATLGGPFCRTDNSTLTYHIQTNIVTGGCNNINAVMTNEYAPTDLSVTYHSTASYSGSSETDVILQHGSGVPTGLDGITWCNDAVSSYKCDQHYIRFRSDWPGRFLSSHEIGHSVGLTHPEDANPAQSSTDSTFQNMVTPVFTDNLGAHNSERVNATY